jgi:hypothetical protein
MIKPPFRMEYWSTGVLEYWDLIDSYHLPSLLLHVFCLGIVFPSKEMKPPAEGYAIRLKIGSHFLIARLAYLNSATSSRGSGREIDVTSSF